MIVKWGNDAVGTSIGIDSGNLTAIALNNANVSIVEVADPGINSLAPRSLAGSSTGCSHSEVDSVVGRAVIIMAKQACTTQVEVVHRYRGGLSNSARR